MTYCNQGQPENFVLHLNLEVKNLLINHREIIESTHRQIVEYVRKVINITAIDNKDQLSIQRLTTVYILTISFGCCFQ